MRWATATSIGAESSPRPTWRRWFTVCAASAVVLVLLPAVCWSADVNGDGSADQVAVQQESGEAKLRVVIAAGADLTLPLDAPALGPYPRLLGSADVDGQPGDDLFVDLAHISTYDTIAVFSLRDDALTRIFRGWAFGSDVDSRFGLSCIPSQRRIVTRTFALTGRSRWSRTTVVNTFRSDGTLRRGKTRRASVRSVPRRQVGVHCGLHA